MPEPLKRTTYRVYLNTENSEMMQTACEKLEIPQSELLSKLVAAGLRALYVNRYRMALPLRFVMDESETEPRNRVNESGKQKRK